MARHQTHQTLIASAAKVPLGDRNAGAFLGKRQNWQTEALAFRRDVPEIGFASRFVGNALGKLRLYVGYRPDGADPNEPPVAVDAEESDVPDAVAAAAIAELDRLKSAPMVGRAPSHSSLLRRLAVNLDLVGEAFLVGVDASDEAVDGRTEAESWWIRSISEVVTDSTGVVKVKDSPGQNEGRELRKDRDTCIRLYVQDEEWSGLAASPMQYLLTECRLLQALASQMWAEANSRMSAGLLFVANEIAGQAITPAGASNPTEDPFMEAVMETLTEPVADTGSAASIVPAVFRAPHQYIKDGVRHVSLGREPDQKLDDRIRARVDRIARGLDLPVEVVMGHASTTFANAEQIDQDTFEDHLAPRCVQMVEMLTQGFLTPHLRDNPSVTPDWADRLEVWFDPAPLLGQPDPTMAADEGHDRFVISDAAWRRTRGFDDDDAPSATEVLTRILIKRGQMNGDLTGALLRWLVENLRADDPALGELVFPAFTNPPVEPGSIMPAPEQAPIPAPAAPARNGQGADQVQASAGTDQTVTSLVAVIARLAEQAAAPAGPVIDANTTALRLPHPDSIVAAAQVDPMLGARLVAIDRDLRTRIQVAATDALERALERAGNRLKAKAGAVRDSLRAAAVAPRYAAAHLVEQGLWAAAGETADTLLKDAWDTLESQFRQWGSHAGTEAIDVVGRAVSGFSLADRQAMGMRMAKDLDEAWGWFREGLDAVAGDRLFNPDGSIPDGEFDPTMKVPSGLVRQAINIMGGSTPIGSATDEDAWIGTDRPRGLAFGETIGGAFLEAGGTVDGYVWDYGPAGRARPFPPHARLDGQRFTDFTDPALLNTGGFPASSHYFPGDHKGCVCDFVPQLVPPPPAAPPTPPRVEPAVPDPLPKAGRKPRAPKPDPAPQVAAAPAAPAGTLLPSAVVQYATPAARKAYGPTFEALDRLHGVNLTTLDPVTVMKGGKSTQVGGWFSPAKRGPKPRRAGKDAATYRAQYTAWLTADPTPQIQINNRGDGTDLFSLLHEFGHRLDWQGGKWNPKMTKADGYRFMNPKTATPEMAAFLRAADASHTIQNVSQVVRDYQFVLYFRAPHEVWARAYSQWAAHKLGGVHLDALRAQQRGASYYQWTDAEFEELGPLVEGVLRSWGVLS